MDFVAPNDDTIDECKRQKAFLESASFSVMALREKWKKIDSFESILIDALKYIKEHFDEYKNTTTTDSFSLTCPDFNMPL